MEEMIDIYNEQTGEKTGKIISKKEAHKKGIWHSSIHLLIVSSDKTKTLLQKRCSLKDLYPSTWDIAVGGHISAGEDSEITIKREFNEELGLNPDNYKFEFVTKTKEILNNNGVDSREFVFIYVLYSDINIDDITLQKEEVESVKWYNKEEFNNLINDNKVIPHKEDYKILNEILIGD